MAAYAQLVAVTSSPVSVLELPTRQPAVLANRRTLPRVFGAFTVHIEGDTFKGVDLSFGGLLCIGPEPVWPGNTLPMTVRLSGDAVPVALMGQVVELVPHKGQVAMRVRFTDFAQADRRRLASWMASR